MGLLDKKVRIIDMALTERGRELLAQNRLSIEHYAFSDDLIDYSGSLVQALRQSASIDDVVDTNYIPLEACSMGGAGLPRDLLSFLYSCPEQRSALPPFETNVSGALNLTRTYRNYGFTDFTVEQLGVSADGDFVIVTQRDDTAAGDREAQYAAEQDIDRLAQEDPAFISLTKR